MVADRVVKAYKASKKGEDMSQYKTAGQLDKTAMKRAPRRVSPNRTTQQLG